MGASPLIQVDELARLLASPPPDPAGPPDRPGQPVILDVRYRISGVHGRPEFERAHIPGASYVDMNTELATIRADAMGGRHPMPTSQTFTAAMRSVGVTMSRPVVVYDDWASLPASRLWWLLRHAGFLDVRVLDGGFTAWTAVGQPTESGPCAPGVGDFAPTSEGIGRLLDATDAATFAARHVLLDARSDDRFHGENETIDPVAGHIPGAVSAPALANVDSGGRFLTADELAGRFHRLGTTLREDHAGPKRTADAGTASHQRRVGTYCGSGIQATHLALALSVAGITDDADVYIGSWSDWITDPTRPVEA